MFKKILFSFCFLALFSCAMPKNPLSGEYQTIESTRLNRLWYNLFGEKLLYGMSLKLNSDSTYIYTSCSQLNIGKWFVEKDTLKLRCEKQSFLLEKENKNSRFKQGTLCSDHPRILLIDGNTLVERVYFKNHGTYMIKLNRK